MDYQMYLQTGQCPLAIDLQYLITGLAARDQLDNTAGENLQAYGEFTNDLYVAVSGGTAPGAFIPYVWKATNATGNVLTGNFVNASTNTPVCSFVLDKTGTGIVNWDDIVSISQLKYTATVGSNYEFNAIAALMGTNGAVIYKTIHGSTCLKITGCIFPPQCDANDLAEDLSALMSALQVNGQLTSNATVNLNSSPVQYQLFITPAIKNALGVTNTNVGWKHTLPNLYELFDITTTNPTKVLAIRFTSFSPNTYANPTVFSTVKYFAGIKSKYQNFFEVKGADALNNPVVTITGSVELVNGAVKTGLSMGSCGLPKPFYCKGDEFQLREDLEALLKDVLLKRPFTGNIDLTQSPHYTSLIQSYFPADLTGTSSLNSGQAFVEAYTDSLIFSIQSEKGDCKMILHHEGPSPHRYFNGLIGFDGPLTPYGPTAADNNQYIFFIVGIYLLGKQPVKDTIWGESCLPLKMCDPCLDGPKPPCVVCDSISIFPPKIICKNNPVIFGFETVGCSGNPQLISDFGDGTVSSEPVHTYADAGVYTVTLTYASNPACPRIFIILANATIQVKDCGRPGTNKKAPIVVDRTGGIKPANDVLVPTSRAQCEDLYQQYVNAYRAFEKKQRIRRTCKEYQITSPLYSYEEFLITGLCNSPDGIALLMDYIKSFVAAPPCPGVMPTIVPTNPGDPCKNAYDLYLTAISNYNEYVAGHPGLKLPPIVNIYTYADFLSGGFCHCVEAYTAFLQTIINETANLNDDREALYWQLNIANTCPPLLKPPCDPPMLQDTFISPPYVPYTNPCVQYQIDLAYANAANAYQQYVDSLTTWIAAKYNEHCLKAFESFTAIYEDKEYHFTLYYYDQAGNLVKTIPPEGVRYVTAAADFQTINNDRTFNKHSFFTNHTMATTYVYNSLNQLVRQSMPDHDLMDIWEYSLPNGLDPRLKVTATQFVTATKGYLSGYIDVVNIGTPAFTRGYLYTTNDGGVTWTKMNDLVASDLKKVQMEDALNGFAVGNHGIVLKTTDGASWDMLAQPDVPTTLNDLYFTTASNGILIGYNGVILKTVDAGVTFTSIAPSIMSGMKLNSITYDGANLYIGASTANGQGRLLKVQ
ncbi:MAG: hypothetical protein IPN33_22155 [Saprospiraceae bacterium]|nr:hypothetical protein [Saprospiraceae bacterium]